MRSSDGTAFIVAGDDFEAAQLYLNDVRLTRSAATYRAYKKEIGRFLGWCAAVRRKSFSDFGPNDYGEYKQFLLNPPAAWVAPAGQGPGRAWRPFAGELSPSSVTYAFRALSAMLTWLVAQNWLRGNVISANHGLMKRPRTPRANRRIPQGGLDAIRDYLASLPIETPAQLEAARRTQLVMSVGLGMALRRSEIAAATMGQFQIEPDHGTWTWVGVRKGGGEHGVGVPLFVIDALVQYRVALGLPPYPEPAESMPMVRALGTDKPVTGEWVKQMVQQVCTAAAERLACLPVTAERTEAIRRLRAATTHWLRHTRLSELLEQGATLKEVSEVAGHESIATTGTYLHAEGRRLYQSAAFQRSPIA
ncbi:tyrosine-type recombinase/integrase [Sinimarinibacterium sp. CAU 1509]|uniref:tyrosine-type recombinase/integrase n=1 Tax=Sinimarinibacterium sp. CAU 1509 TaxID=2562283 RepID=UPI00146C0017|nr:site-specific integrase [Sinimarinibacterium sp. CAU 1509]